MRHVWPEFAGGMTTRRCTQELQHRVRQLRPQQPHPRPRLLQLLERLVVGGGRHAQRKQWRARWCPTPRRPHATWRSQTDKVGRTPQSQLGWFAAFEEAARVKVVAQAELMAKRMAERMVDRMVDGCGNRVEFRNWMNLE